VKRMILGFIILFVLGNVSPVLALEEWENGNLIGDKDVIPKEPGWRAPSYRGWELLSVPGLISTYYDLDLDGKLDYMVIRKVMRKAYATETTMEQAIEIARFDKLAVYFSTPLIYFTNKNPLFFCLGVDYRKNCEDIWVDIAEDGLNGNEQRYSLSTPQPNVR
jgi:hypothetical protein